MAQMCCLMLLYHFLHDLFDLLQSMAQENKIECTTPSLPPNVNKPLSLPTN